MTTVTSIITDALRETNLIALGVAPTTAQRDEAFRRLQSIVSSCLGNEAGENLNPMPLGQNDINSPQGYPWYANELPGNVFIQTNTRIMANLTGPGLINLHPIPHDGARMGVVDVSGNFATNPLTIRGNGRKIDGADQVVLSVNSTAKTWVYREDVGNWVTAVPLVLEGEMPWPAEFDDMFIIMLAMRLNPRYGQVINPASVSALQDVTTKFTARYSQSTTQVGSENGLLYLTGFQRFAGRNLDTYGSSDAFFNAGIPY